MNRKWQLLCLVLATALIVSASLNIYQSFDASNDGSGGNPSSDNDASQEMNFTFTWGPDTQKIVQGEFRLKVGIKRDIVTIVENVTMETLTMHIEASDDDYESGTM